MTENKPAAHKPKLGEVVKTAEGRYALVVGFEKVKHVHQDQNGSDTDRVEREHPVVVDLPGTPRRHEIEVSPL